MMLYKKADNCEHFPPGKSKTLVSPRISGKLEWKFTTPDYKPYISIRHTYPYAIHDISISKGSQDFTLAKPMPKRMAIRRASLASNQPTV